MRARRWVASLVAVGSVAASVAFLPAGATEDRDPRWNVVVIVTDDQDMSSIQQDPPVMPYLRAATQDPSGHWVVFENGFANTPLCCPSRATLLTGQYAHEHGVTKNDDALLLDQRTTIAAWLDEAGYHTGLVGKYLNQYPFGRSPFVPQGWDEWVGKEQGTGKTVYYDYTLVQQGVEISYGRSEADYITDVLAEDAVAFVRDAPLEDPFLLWFAPTAPHPPWTPAPRHRGAFEDLEIVESPSVGELDVSDKPEWVQDLSPLGKPARARLIEERRLSYETLLAVDDAIRDIVEALEARGDLERTMIVFVSDNGYSFGEHRWVKKTCPYEECTHVPYMIRFPGVAAREERVPVSSVDLAPTIAEVAGLAPPDVSGSSLVPLLLGQPSGGPAEVFLEYAGDGTVPRWWQVRTRRYAYIELSTGERELYDLRKDPSQMTNVVEEPGYQAIVDRLSASLALFRGW
jgi:arylsulfatase A-like enzyme